MKSWKTSLGGALVCLGAAIGQIYPEHAKEGALLAALGTAFGLVFARDNNVSSEAAGVRSQASGDSEQGAGVKPETPDAKPHPPSERTIL